MKRLAFLAAVVGVFSMIIVGCSEKSPQMQERSVATRPEQAPATSPGPQGVVPAARSTLRGKVVAAKTGMVLAGTKVFLVYSGPDGTEQRLVAEATTGADGGYVFADAIEWPKAQPTQRADSASRYYVFALHPEMGFSFAVLQQGDKTDDLPVKLFQKKINTVKVVDQDGKPVMGALVFYQGGNITEQDAPEWDSAHRWSNLRTDVGILSAVTDAQGEVKLAGLYDGCNYVVQKAGYAKNYGETNIPLLPGRSVQGRVTNPDGQPAAGALVKCTFSGERLGWDETTRADADGKYVFLSVPTIGYYYGFAPAAKGNDKGTITITAVPNDAASGLLSKPVVFPAKVDDTQARDVVMVRGVVIGGQIVDDRTDQPIPGVTMQCYILVEGQSSYDDHTVKTDVHGRFQTVVPPGARFFARWEDSRDGSYVLDHEWMRKQTDASGNNRNYEYEPIQIQSVTTDQTDIVLKLRLWDVQPLLGKAVDAQGNPVAKAQVYLNTIVPSVRAEADGTFVFKTAPKDRDFELCVMSLDKTLGTIQKFPAGTKSATITLNPTQSRDGVVTTPAGLAANGLKFYMDLKLNGESHYRLRMEPTTDAKGHFKVAGLLPGAKYGIFWSSDNEENRDYDYGNAEVDLALLKEGEPIHFQAKMFLNSLMGQVVDPAGKPLADAQITLAQNTDLMAQDQRMSGAQVIVSDKKGNFLISRLADGELTLKVTAEGWKPALVKTATDNVDCKVTMRPITDPVVYRATVKDETGKPMRGATVTLYTVTYRQKVEIIQVSAQTGADGVASFPTPTTVPATNPAGQKAPPMRSTQSTMVCDAPGYDLAVFGSAQAGEDLEAQFTLHKSDKAWAGKVVNKQGEPIAGAKISVTGLRGSGGEYGQVPAAENEPIAGFQFTSDGQGKFELSRIPREWVNILVRVPGMKTSNEYFDPQRDSGTAVKTITLQQSSPVKGRISIKGIDRLPVTQQADVVNYVMFIKEDGVRVSGTRLNQDGTFTSEELEPGKYTASFISSDDELGKYVVKQAPAFEARVGQVAEVVIELEEGVAIKGRVNSSTKLEALKGDQAGSVSARKPGADNGMTLAVGKIHMDGSWVMYVPGAGEYSIQCYLGQGVPTESKTILVKDGVPPEEVVIEFKPKP